MSAACLSISSIVSSRNVIRASRFQLLLPPIHHTFGPHVDRAYLRRTLLLSYVPWKYVHGHAPRALKNALRGLFHAEPFLFASGRESLLALLKALKVKPGEEIIIQGYTCIVVPNAIHAAGAVPIYADIDPDTLNLTPESVRPLLTPRTRAVICQHTFGIPAETERLRRLCSEHGLMLIEDMAHIIPDAKGPTSVGTHGDALILSFSRDKAISGIAGGAVISRNAHVTDALTDIERTAEHMPWWTVAKLLEYPSRMYSVIRKLSGTFAVRPAIWMLNTMGLLVPVLTNEEKQGRMSPILHKIPNVCAALALFSLQKLPSLNERRRTITAFFLRHGEQKHWPLLRGVSADLPLQKFPLFVHQARKVRSTLKRENIHLDDGWTGCVVCPEDCSLTESSYEQGSDPAAERACKQILSLPTHPTMTLFQAELLARRIDELQT